MRREARGFPKTTKSKSTRGSQGAGGGGWCKRIITLISGGEIEVEREAVIQRIESKKEK